MNNTVDRLQIRSLSELDFSEVANNKDLGYDDKPLVDHMNMVHKAHRDEMRRLDKKIDTVMAVLVVSLLVNLLSLVF